MDSFVYIWEDIPNQKFYIGTHKGTFNDGYTSSEEELSRREKIKVTMQQIWQQRKLGELPTPKVGRR